MIATLHQGEHSFQGTVEYCLRDARLPEEGQPDTSGAGGLERPA